MMMPTFEEVRKKILKEKEEMKKEIVSLKERIEVLMKSNEYFKGSFLCPGCGSKIERK